MAMYNPPHPGEFIQEVYLEPLGISPRSVALRLKVSPSTFIRILKGQSSISPAMALRLSKCLGRSPESWLHMQDSYRPHPSICLIILRINRTICCTGAQKARAP